MPTTRIYANPEEQDVGYDETLVASSRVSPSIMERWIRESIGVGDAGAPLSNFGAVDECSFAASGDEAPTSAGGVPRLWNDDPRDPESTVAWDFSDECPPDETKLLESPAERTKLLDWNAVAPSPSPVMTRAADAPATMHARTSAGTTYRKGFERADRQLPMWACAALSATFVSVVFGGALIIALG